MTKRPYNKQYKGFNGLIHIDKKFAEDMDYGYGPCGLGLYVYRKWYKKLKVMLFIPDIDPNNFQTDD